MFSAFIPAIDANYMYIALHQSYLRYGVYEINYFLL